MSSSEDKCEVLEDKHKDRRKMKYFCEAINSTEGRKEKTKTPLENVVVMKSVVQQKSHQTSQTGHLGDTSNRPSVQGVYLYNQKEFVYENNFKTRLT